MFLNYILSKDEALSDYCAFHWQEQNSYCKLVTQQFIIVNSIVLKVIWNNVLVDGSWVVGVFLLFLSNQRAFDSRKVSFYSVMGGGMCTQLWMQLADVIIHSKMRSIWICPQMQIWLVWKFSGRTHRVTSDT